MNQTFDPAGFPTAPGDLPLIGHLPKILDDPLALLRRAESSCGPLFWIHMGFGMRFLFYAGPRGLDVLRNPDVAIDYSALGNDRDPARDSVVARDGPAHRAMRSALNPSFSASGLAKGAGAAMAGVVDREAARWIARRRVAPLAVGRSVAIDDIFAVIGVDPKAATAWSRAYRFVMSALLPIPVYSRIAADASLGWLDARIRELVTSARVRHGGTTLLDFLVADSDRARMPEHEIVGNVRFLAIAGHETTATVSAWSLIHAAADSVLWSRLVAECAESPTPTTLAEAAKFPVAEAVFREAARLYPPLWFLARKTARDTTIDGRDVPAKTPLAVSPLWMSRDPKVFADSEKFDVSRWLGRPVSAPELIAFGGGPHFCMGYHMAMLEGVQLLVAVTREFVRSGLSPRLVGTIPHHRYTITGHPPSSTRIDLVATPTSSAKKEHAR